MSGYRCFPDMAQRGREGRHMTQTGHSAFSRFLPEVALQRLPMIVSRWGQSCNCGVHQRSEKLTRPRKLPVRPRWRRCRHRSKGNFRGHPRRSRRQCSSWRRHRAAEWQDERRPVRVEEYPGPVGFAGEVGPPSVSRRRPAHAPRCSRAGRRSGASSGRRRPCAAQSARGRRRASRSP